MSRIILPQDIVVSDLKHHKMQPLMLQTYSQILDFIGKLEKSFCFRIIVLPAKVAEVRRSTMSGRIPVYSMQDELIGYASNGLARKLKQQGVAEVFTKDPYTLRVAEVPMLDHPLLKEVTMAQREQSKNAAKKPGIDESKISVMNGAQTPPIGTVQKEKPKPPEGTITNGDDLVAEAKRLQSTARSGTVAANEEIDPNGIYVSNRYIDHTIIVSDMFLSKDDHESALVWKPGEVKRLDLLGEIFINGIPTTIGVAKDLLKSNYMTRLIAQKILVLGRLSPKQMVRHGYWDGRVSPKEVVDTMSDKTKGGTFQVELNKKNDWYFGKLVERIKQEDRINDAVAGTDPNADILKDAAELDAQDDGNGDPQ